MIVWLLALGLAGGTPDDAVSLDWKAPETDCPSADSVRARIDALAADGARGAVEATVVVERGETGYVAELSVTGGEGHTKRRLEAATCDAVAEAAAVIVAVHRPSSPEVEAPADDLVPAPVTSEEPESSDVPEAEPSADPPTLEAPAPPAEPPVEPRTRVRAAIALEGSAAAGALPLGIRVGAGAALLHPRVRAEVTGRYWLASDPSQGPRARVSLTTATVRIGPVFTFGPVELIPRAVLELGAARGAGAGVSRRRTAWRPWIAAGIAPAVLWPVRPRFALGLTGELLGVLLRPTFEVGGVGTVFSARSISGGGGVIAEVRFP